MKLLDGGLEGWKAKGYSTEIMPPQVSSTQFRLFGKTKSTEPLLCNLPEVREALKEPNKIVLDVRAREEFLGEKILSGATRAGRIPGVKWIEWKEVLIKEGPFKGYWRPSEEIKKLFANLGVTPDKEIYIY
jgi:thiosulfate/3-mercaptopyruvate sulfurtransferase